MTNLFSLQCDALPASTHVVGFRGREGISQLYQLEIGIQVAGAGLDLARVVGERATLVIDCGTEAPPHLFHGIVASLEHLHQAGTDVLYGLRLAPKLWGATLTRHSRVFTARSVPDIARAVLAASGLESDDYEIRLLMPYPPRELVCQYQESNYVFLARWLEREGLYYFFEHGESKEKLVITDSRQLHAELSNACVRHVPTGSDDSMALEAVDSWRCRRSLPPASVQLSDYNYLVPDLELVSSAPVSSDGWGTVSSFGDNFQDQVEGDILATRRAEELRARQEVFVGHGRVFHLRPGYVCKLSEHPSDRFNAEYLVVELRHVGNQSARDPRIMELLGLESHDEYAVTIEAIDAGVQYRPRRRTPWPRVDGYELGTVCGPTDSEYAQLDEHGRYLVRFRFDESGLPDGEASARVRLLQFHGGEGEGAHFPLIKGTEVLLLFLGGDPDRPTIAGTLPNARQRSQVSAANASSNVLRTPGGNALVMEDARGAQAIDLSCPVMSSSLHLGAPSNSYHVALLSEGHAHFDFGGQWVTDVHGTCTLWVELATDYNFDSTFWMNVVDATTLYFQSTLEMTVSNTALFTYQGPVTVAMQGPYVLTVTETHNETIDGDMGLVCHGNMTTTVDGSWTAAVHAERTDTTTGKHVIQAGKRLHHEVTPSFIDLVPAKIEINDGAACIVLTGDCITIKCKDLTIDASGKITTKSGGNTNIVGAEVLINP